MEEMKDISDAEMMEITGGSWWNQVVRLLEDAFSGGSHPGSNLPYV